MATEAGALFKKLKKSARADDVNGIDEAQAELESTFGFRIEFLRWFTLAAMGVPVVVGYWSS